MVDGRWMEGGGGEGQWNRRGLCSQRIGSRLGSFNFIPFLRQTVPFHFSRLLSGKTSPVYEHLFFSFSLRNTVWAQVRSIKVREFLFKSNRKHCKRISIDAFEMMIIYDFFLEKYFLYFFFFMKRIWEKNQYFWWNMITDTLYSIRILEWNIHRWMEQSKTKSNRNPKLANNLRLLIRWGESSPWSLSAYRGIKWNVNRGRVRNANNRINIPEKAVNRSRVNQAVCTVYGAVLLARSHTGQREREIENCNPTVASPLDISVRHRAEFAPQAKEVNRRLRNVNQDDSPCNSSSAAFEFRDELSFRGRSLLLAEN